MSKPFHILFNKMSPAAQKVAKAKAKRMLRNRRPIHPGAILAERLGVSRRTISQILNEHRPLTPDMAIRLSHLLDTTPESWLNMQQVLDVWELEHKNARIYEQIKKVA